MKEILIGYGIHHTRPSLPQTLLRIWRNQKATKGKYREIERENRVFKTRMSHVPYKQPRPWINTCSITRVTSIDCAKSESLKIIDTFEASMPDHYNANNLQNWPY